jgi:hypothetical protein
VGSFDLPNLGGLALYQPFALILFQPVGFGGAESR